MNVCRGCVCIHMYVHMYVYIYQFLLNWFSYSCINMGQWKEDFNRMREGILWQATIYSELEYWGWERGEIIFASLGQRKCKIEKN